MGQGGGGVIVTVKRQGRGGYCNSEATGEGGGGYCNSEAIGEGGGFW